jgi:hypothetical protein
MSVMIGLRIKVDPARFLEVANGDTERLVAISNKAKGMGALAHRFYGGDGEVLVVDEWESKEQFLEFFGSTPQIGEMMGEAGVTEQPTPLFWTELDTPDKF